MIHSEKAVPATCLVLGEECRQEVMLSEERGCNASQLPFIREGAEEGNGQANDIACLDIL